MTLSCVSVWGVIVVWIMKNGRDVRGVAAYVWCIESDGKCTVEWE